MSHAQWLAQAKIYQIQEQRERESQSKLIEEVFSASIKAFRETLIRILGTNIGAGKPKNPDDPTPFYPMSMIVGRPEVLEELIQREQEELRVTAAVEDPELDKFNDELMNIDFGDIEPLLNSGINSDDPLERWKSDEWQQMLRDMGIEVVGGNDVGVESDDFEDVTKSHNHDVDDAEVLVNPADLK